MIVEPEIRSGINLMKYCVNQPHMFRNAVDKDHNLRPIKVLPAFLLGFGQCTISILVEYVIVFYLSSMNNLMTIFMKFAALTSIINIDNIYGNALWQNKMKKHVG